VAISQHGTSVLFTSHPQDGLVVNFYIPHNRRTPLQAEEALINKTKESLNSDGQQFYQYHQNKRKFKQ
jgi:hypothetical protein